MSQVSRATCHRFALFGATGLLCLALTAGDAFGQVNVSAAVDRNRVLVGERVALTVSVASSGGAPSVQPPALPDLPGVAVSGPHGPSSSQQITIVGGSTSRTSTISYTFYLTPGRPGDVTIPALDVVVDGRPQRTEPIRLVVSKAGAGADEPPLQVRVKLSRSTAYQGQQVLVEYLLFERVSGAGQVTNRQISGEPTFTGFWVEPLFDARKAQVGATQEVISGVAYSVMPILRVAVFPTTSGALEIPPLGLTAVVAVPTGSRDFWGRVFYREQTITVSSPERTIDVRPLPPNPPVGFGGAVGTYRLTSSVDRTEVSQGDPVTWTVTLEGEGNLKATGDLVIPPLGGFRAYDPQVTTSLSSSADRYGGRKTYERVLVPLHSGMQRIPPVSFAFFDPETEQYRTITSRAHELAVRPAERREGAPLALGLTQAEIREVGSDIRFIQPDAVILEDETRTIWHSRWYWMVHAVPFALVIGALGVRWRRTYRGENPARFRALGARSEARKRLKTARALLKRKDLRKATGALGEAISELIAAHSGASASGLTSDRIRSLLGERGVSEELIGRTLGVLDRCDRAQYAPSGVSEAEAHELYEMGFALTRELMRHLKP